MPTAAPAAASRRSGATRSRRSGTCSWARAAISAPAQTQLGGVRHRRHAALPDRTRSDGLCRPIRAHGAGAEGGIRSAADAAVGLHARTRSQPLWQERPERGIGSGLSSGSLSLRLRYEVTRQFAPYVGVSFERKFGQTADYASGRRRPFANRDHGRHTVLVLEGMSPEARARCPDACGPAKPAPRHPDNRRARLGRRDSGS